MKNLKIAYPQITEKAAPRMTSRMISDLGTFSPTSIEEDVGLDNQGFGDSKSSGGVSKVQISRKPAETQREKRESTSVLVREEHERLWTMKR